LFSSRHAVEFSFTGFFQVAAVEEAGQRIADGLNAKGFLEVEVGQGYGDVLGDRNGELPVFEGEAFSWDLCAVVLPVLLFLKVQNAQPGALRHQGEARVSALYVFEVPTWSCELSRVDDVGLSAA
jgi:hypothetical protein